MYTVIINLKIQSRPLSDFSLNFIKLWFLDTKIGVTLLSTDENQFQY